MSQATLIIAAGASFALWAASYATGSIFLALSAAATSAITLGVWTFNIRKGKETTTPSADAQPADPSPPAIVKPIRLVQPDSASPDAVVRALLRNATFAGTAVAAHLWLEDPSSATLRLVAATGSQRPSDRPIPLDEGVLGEAVSSGAALMRPVRRLTSISSETTVWCYAVPVASPDAVGVAVIDFSQSDEPNRDALNEISAALRISVSGALALHVAAQRETDAHTLMEAIRQLSRCLDPEGVTRGALDAAMSMSDASTGSVMLLAEEESSLTIVAAQGLPEEIVTNTQVALGEGIAGWVASSGQPLLVEDLPGRPGRSDRHGVRSAVSVPIADEDGLLGVLNVGSRTFPARFTTEHLNTLELLGRQTAIALRNARAAATAGELYFDSLKALALALETKDPYAQGGTERVLEYARALGESMGLASSSLRALEIAAMLHDVGMTGLASSTSACSRPLSTVERGLIKMHPAIAADILEQAPALREVAPIVYHHHERYDGSGYIDGISGEQIPLGARVLSVADAYVAMTSDRPYRAAKSHEQALTELQENAGTQFDPDVVQAFTDLQGAGADRVRDQER